MDMLYLLAIFACQVLMVKSQARCNVEAIQQCTASYASTISSQDQPTVDVICRAYRGFQDCLEPYTESCRENPLYKKFVEAQGTIADQCSAVITGEEECDGATLYGCLEAFTGDATEPLAQNETCRRLPAFEACVAPFNETCFGKSIFLALSSQLKALRAACEQVAGCDVEAVTECLTDYTDAVRSARTRLKTCQLVATLRRCVRPHQDGCQNIPAMETIFDYFEGTRETCGDGRPSRICNIEAIGDCMSKFSLASGSARTRLESCRLVDSLRDCISPYRNDCENEYSFQQVLAMFRNTDQICADGSDSSCNIQAVGDCMTQYQSSIGSARTRMQTCRLVWALKRCVRPHRNDCQNNPVMQQISSVFTRTQETCSDSSGSRCDVDAVSDCMNIYKFSSRSARTRLQTCRAVAALRNCVSPLTRECQLSPAFQPVTAVFQNTEETCADGSESSCNVQRVTACMTQYTDSSRRARTRLGACRAYKRLERCIRDQEQSCQSHSVFDSIRTIQRTMRETCSEGEIEESCRDWNNTVIQSGEIFAPTRTDPCHRCLCDNGFMVACKTVACVPPRCEGAQQVPDTCCEFICPINPPTPEPEPKGVATCRDWNNTVIQSGDMFAPKENDPCHRCMCDNGKIGFCRMIFCDAPPCPGAQIIPGTCCGFICPEEILTPEPESVTCRDWNNTVIQSGDIFAPRQSDPCFRCMCENGVTRYCRTIYCDVPSCPGAQLIPGTCCGFICPEEELVTPEPKAEPVVKECPEGWTIHEEKCYYVSRDKLSWPSSQVMCKSIKGRLVQIASEEENTFVKNLTVSQGVTNFWIGVTDIEVVGTYKFNGEDSPLEYTDWKRRSPPKHRTYNCVEVKQARVFNWRPTSCKKRIYFVCERRP